MPDTPYTPRPQVLGQQRRTPQEAVVAQQHDYGGAVDPESPLVGLVRGLSTLNPALTRHLDTQEQKHAKGVPAVAKAVGQTLPNPREALSGAPIDLPREVPQAWAPTFKTTLAETLAHRVGVQNKTETAAAYNDLKDTEGFQVGPWLAEKRAAALQGIIDPHAQAIIGQHFTELEAHIEADAERVRMARRDEVRATTMTQVAADMFTADMSPDKVFEAYPVFLERSKGMGYTAKESAQFLYAQLDQLSGKLGGAPELFDVFDRKDAEGITLIARNPQLAEHVERSRTQAKRARDKAITDAAMQSNAIKLGGYEKDLDEAPEKITWDRIIGDMGQFGPINSAEHAASMWARAQDSLRKKLATESFLPLAEAGELWRLSGEQQTKVLDSIVAPTIQALAKAAAEQDAPAIANAGAQIMQLHSRTGASVPVEPLQQWVKTMVSNLPNPNGPPAQFTAAAELYKALSANPQYRDLYFKDDAAEVLKNYVSAANAGSDPKSAYVAAYQSVGPEAKAAAQAMVSSKDFQKRVADIARRYVEGSSWVPRWLGGNNRPENVASLNAAVAAEARRYLVRNPSATEKDTDEFMERWSEQNFVLDTTTHMAVKVPPGLGGRAAQQALSSYSERLAREYKLASRSDATWSVQYLPTGTEGHYHVVLTNGMAMAPAGSVSLPQLLDIERQKKILTEPEKLALSGIRRGLREGQVPHIEAPLLAKAEALKVFTPDEVKTYRSLFVQQFKERLQAIPEVGFGKPTFDNLQFLPGRGSIDRQLTSRTAFELSTSPMTASYGHHVGPAASLITLGEGVALKVYADPARGAGNNIGMGYNLKANADKVDDDLKRAGVRPEHIASIKQGTMELTPDQAKRLLLVAMPRYEKQVMALAEDTQKGLWNRMTPAQRAVMIDIAWQVGDASKFKKAWDALAANDSKTFAEETKVTYVDRSGERKEDSRRNSLRAAMLAGLSFWDATIEKFGALPASKLQAMSMGTSPSP